MESTLYVKVVCVRSSCDVDTVASEKSNKDDGNESPATDKLGEVIFVCMRTCVYVCIIVCRQ